MDPAATSEGDSVASVADDTQETTGAEREGSRTRSSYVPLNSTRITAGQLRSLGTALGVPVSGNVSDLRLMIEGQITEGGRDPRNVQVLLSRSKEDVSVSLRDYEGIFLTVTPGIESERRDDSDSPREPFLSDPVEDTPADELQAIRSERDALREEMRTMVEEKTAFQEQVDSLTQEVEASKARAKEIWRLSCEQVEDFAIAAKEQEIAQLRAQLEARANHRRPSPSPSEDSVSEPTTLPSSREPRRGRAPPIDKFSGESPEIRLDDWLPSLQRAASWNKWTEEEQLIQLAGHLKGRALIEWNLLSRTEIGTMEAAVKSLRECLEPCSKVMAGQDFRRTMQKDTETVADFICRLERTFCIAFGSDKLSKETKDAMLYGQLQEGLRLSIIRSPSVLGALAYKELCMAAKHEEKRQLELRKRQESERISGGRDNRQRDNRLKQDRRSNDRGELPIPDNEPTSLGNRNSSAKKCYICNQSGHLAKNCRRGLREREATGNLNKNSTGAGTRQVSSEDRRIVPSVSPAERSETSEPIRPPMGSVDPLLYLYSSDSEGQVDTIRVNDEGSRPQYVNVEIQGVPTSGIIDTGADITIMGGELFKKVAFTAKLRKKNFHKPDRTPHTYDRKPFQLHGKIELEIAFAGKTLLTSVYVKMDAHDQLLLSEGVCSQLGILEYHKDVWPGRDLHSTVTSQTADIDQTNQETNAVQCSQGTADRTGVPPTRTYQVRLQRPVTIPANKVVSVPVEVEEDCFRVGPLLLECDESIAKNCGLTVEETFFQPTEEGLSSLKVYNVSGFTERMEEGTILGKAVEACTVEPSEECSSIVGTVATVGDQVPRSQEHDRHSKLQELIGEPDLPEHDRDLLCGFLMDHHDVFALEDTDRGETDLVQLEIDTGGASPIKQPIRRMPYAAKEEVARQLRKMQQLQVIQPSKSPWASPVVLVQKKDGSHGFCVDYRGLNDVTKADNYPLPCIDDLLDELGKAKFFSTLDLASGIWQIRVHTDSQEKTAFSTPFGLYEFKVMPFGLKDAPSVFQRLMQQVLSGVNPDDGPSFVTAYIDDLLVFSSSLQEHLEHLYQIIRRLKEVGLKINPAKCQFIRKEVQYLGHVITPEGLCPNKRLVEAVQNYTVPSNVQELRRFMGLASYYRRFVPQFAKIANPLHQLTCKGATFQWSEDCQAAFLELKKRLMNPPVLAYPNFDLDFVLETDASHQGLGAVLSQRQADGQLHPIAFASRALSAAERNYGITDLETLGVIWAVSHYHYYLYGHCVTVYTDHSAVKAVLETASPSGRHARWWTRVFSNGIKHVTVLHRAGRDNVAADALSRNPTGSSLKRDIVVGESQVAAIKSVPSTIEQVLKSNPAGSGVSYDLSEEQMKDDDVKMIKEYLVNGTLPEDKGRARSIAAEAPSFCLINGILYYVDCRRGNTKRVVVPRALRNLIITENHCGPCAGHFAGNKMYNMLVKHWYWKGMYEDVMNYCRKCPQCVFVSGSGKCAKPPLHPIPVSKPFQIIGVDVMDLPITEDGNKHVVVFQDYFTKWPMVYPVPDQKTTRLVELLTKEIIPFFGVPEALLSADRGTNLLSHLMTDVCARLGITKLNTTAYHPECDGMVERFNRTLKTMLRKHVSRFSSQWDRYLPGILWAYRNTPHDSTGEKTILLIIWSRLSFIDRS